MWKRNESDDPASSAPAEPSRQMRGPAREPEGAQSVPDAMPRVGRGISIKGELMGKEDLAIDGHVEGAINLQAHELTIGASARIKAQIKARSVIVLGRIHGDVTATERIEVRQGGAIDGDVTAPRVAIAEGSHFRGRIDMSPTAAGQEAQGKPREASPATPQRAGRDAQPKAASGAGSR